MVPSGLFRHGLVHVHIKVEFNSDQTGLIQYTSINGLLVLGVTWMVVQIRVEAILEMSHLNGSKMSLSFCVVEFCGSNEIE